MRGGAFFSTNYLPRFCRGSIYPLPHDNHLKQSLPSHLLSLSPFKCPSSHLQAPHIYNGFPPIKSLHLLTSLGMTPFSLNGNFTLIHLANSTAVFGSINSGTPKSTALRLIT